MSAPLTYTKSNASIGVAGELAVNESTSQRGALMIQCIDSAQNLRFWLLTRAEARNGAPTSLASGFIELGPGQAYERLGESADNNAIFIAGATADSGYTITVKPGA